MTEFLLNSSRIWRFQTRYISTLRNWTCQFCQMPSQYRLFDQLFSELIWKVKSITYEANSSINNPFSEGRLLISWRINLQAKKNILIGELCSPIILWDLATFLSSHLSPTTCLKSLWAIDFMFYTVKILAEIYLHLQVGGSELSNT
jgi:hypothetical protein